MEKKRCSDCIFFKPHYEKFEHLTSIGFCIWPSKDGDHVSPPVIIADSIITRDNEERGCSNWEGKGIRELISDFLSHYLTLKKTGEKIGERLSELLRPLIPDIECKLVSDIAINLKSSAKEQESFNSVDWDELCAYKIEGFSLGEFLSGFYGTGIFESRIFLTWEELKELLKIFCNLEGGKADDNNQNGS